jgi:hypothetical protein
MNETDVSEMDERIAEVDADVEGRVNTGSGKATNGVARSNKMAIDDDDDDDSDNGESFVNTNRTIVAEG